MLVIEASTGYITQQHHTSIQGKGRPRAAQVKMTTYSGLGEFSKLPPEIRRMVWINLMPECGNMTARHLVFPFTPGLRKEASELTLDTFADGVGELPILRTSRQLYWEISAKLYRVMDLHIHISPWFRRYEGDVPRSPPNVPWRRCRKIVFFVFDKADQITRPEGHSYIEQIPKLISQIKPTRLPLSLSSHLVLPKFDLEINFFLSPGTTYFSADMLPAPIFDSETFPIQLYCSTCSHQTSKGRSADPVRLAGFCERFLFQTRDSSFGGIWK